MAYIVDLVIILYMIASQHVAVSMANVKTTLRQYKGEKCPEVHTEIRTFIDRHRKSVLYISDAKKDRVFEKIVEMVVKYTVKQT